MRRTWIYIVLIISVLFIWSNSLRPPDDSAHMSGAALALFERLFGSWPFPFDIRKAAHVVEYALLGLVSAIWLSPVRCARPGWLQSALLLGLGVAVIDESIQIFTGRGAQVQDVLLDFAAYLTVFALVSLVRRRFSPKISASDN